jgi:hypothetical protein
MSSTIISTYTQVPEISTSLWLHIALSSILAFVCVPAIIIFKLQGRAYLQVIEVFTIIVICLMTATGLFVTHASNTTSHKTLGYMLLFVVGCFLVFDVALSGRPENPKPRRYFGLSVPNRLRSLSSLCLSSALVLTVSIEIILGLVSL